MSFSKQSTKWIIFSSWRIIQTLLGKSVECPFKQTCLWSRPTRFASQVMTSPCLQVHQSLYSKYLQQQTIWQCVPTVFPSVYVSQPLTQWPDFKVTLTLGKALQLSQTYNIHPQSTILFYLEAVFEPLGHKVEDYGIDAGVDGCHVDAEVVKYKQETASTEEGQTVVNKKKRFKRRRRLNQYYCNVWQDRENTVDDVSAVSFSQRQKKNLKSTLKPLLHRPMFHWPVFK